EDPKDTFDEVVKFKVFYDKVEQKGDGQGTWVPTPRKNQKVEFTLEATERVGVVLLVNGMNTLNKEEDRRQPDQYSMWILERGRKYTIDGHYTKKKGKGDNEFDTDPFTALSESESVLRLPQLANESKAGKIELLLFRQASGKPLQGAPKPSNLRTELRRE